jgi:hypothetical protein
MGPWTIGRFGRNTTESRTDDVVYTAVVVSSLYGSVMKNEIIPRPGTTSARIHWDRFARRVSK